jgi:lysophospholipase L1-like esterase
VGAKYSMSMQESMTMLYPRVIASDAKTQVESDDDPYDTDDTTADSSGGGTHNKVKNNSNNSLGPADAVVVYIGHNDKVRMANHRESNTKLSDGYEELLLLIRKHRPMPIPIIVIVPTLNAAVTGVATESKRLETCAIQHELWSHLVLYKLGGPAAGGFYLVENEHDPNISLHSTADHGMCLHWNSDSHRKWARGLEPQIRQVLDEVAAASTSAAAVPRQSNPYHGNVSNTNHDATDDDDNSNIDDDVSSKKASSVLATTTTTSTAANPMIAACALPFACFAPECELPANANHHHS